MTTWPPASRLGWLDLAIAATGLWFVAAALNQMWEERAAYSQLNWAEHAFHSLCIGVATGAATLVHEGTHSLGLASLTLGVYVRWHVSMSIHSMIKSRDS